MLKYYFISANILFLFLETSVFAQNWKTYPYHEEGSEIFFPEDEGRHPEMPVEWWYTTAHVTGDSTGTDYSFMLTYFCHPPVESVGFRIFNIANETAGEFYQETLPYRVLERAQDHLNIQVAVIGGSKEEWVTLRDEKDQLIPFQYHLAAHSRHGDIDVWYDTVKRPLIVGDTGYFRLGENYMTYYYSQTALTVKGTLTLNGIKEPITGTAWIDRQYFEEFAPFGGERYTWISCQLSNGMDLNIWNIFTSQNEIPDSENFRICTMYIDEETTLTTSDFNLTRQQYKFMPDGERCYAQKWNFTFEDMNLTFTTKFDDQEVHLPFRFYEGSINIQGTVNGEAVTGVGFAELLHSYEHPEICILSPNGGEAWDGSQPVIWQLLQPDDGRPIQYDLELSTDDRVSYQPIAQGLTDTTYYWNLLDIEKSSDCWLRVTGYSADTTLIGSDETDSSFVIVVTDIRDPMESDTTIQKVITNAYPNPANSYSKIYFQLPSTTSVTLKVFNILGQHIYTLLDRQPYTSGKYHIRWNGEDRNGSRVASGIYIYRLDTEYSTASGQIAIFH